jgi:curli biogenesis system outer membrane secretion channel CsgG
MKQTSPATHCWRAALIAVAAVSVAHAADSPNVEKCSKEMGSLAVAEPQDHILAGLRHYNLGSPALMLRLLAQESGCFAVVERGVAMQNLQQERALANSGQLQGDSNIGGGQMQAADFVMTPGVQFTGDSGGIGGAVGGLLNKLPGGLGRLGGLAGGVSFKEAETTLLVADVRSGIQVASAEGKASKMDFSLGAWGWGGLGWASGGGYSKTPEGKLIAASLLDNFNKVVQTIREKPSLIRSTSQASQKNASQSLQATGRAPVAAVAAAAGPAATSRGGVPLPAGLFGAFNGQFSGGNESGNFSLVVGPNGQVSGIGSSSSAGNFQVTGVVTPDGTLVMGTAAQGGAAAAQFNGFINPGTGEVIGTWRMAAGNTQGTFNGKRQ